jgi:hypothetical protein
VGLRNKINLILYINQSTIAQMISNDAQLEQLYGNNLNDPYRTNTRFNYDPCRTIVHLEQSTGPGRYMLNVPGVGGGDRPEIVMDPLIISQRWSGNLRTNPVEIETALLGLGRPVSRDLPTRDVYQKYTPPNEQITFPINRTNWTEQSRAIAPAWEVRELEQPLWGFPLFNPQENICLPFINNTNTRILEKDYFNRWKCTPMI